MSALTASFATTFAPLKNRNFSLYFGGQAVSLVGTFMQQVAQQWLVWDLTHDARYMGIAGALAFLPMLVFGPFTSAIADRVDRRRLLVVTQIVDMCLAFTLAMLVVAGVREVWPVLVLAALLGTSAAFTIPAQSAFIGDLSGMAEVRSAFTIYGMIIETARLVGPAMAGYVVAWLGVATAFALNGLSFVAVIISLLIVRAQQQRVVARGSALGDFADSMRYMRRQPRIIDLMLCRVMILLCVFSSLQMSAPIADEILHGGPALLGTMLAASGAGALVGALLIAPVFQRARRAGIALCMALAWSGVWLVIMSWFTTTALIILGIFMFSVNIPVVLTNVSSLTQLLSPAAMRARLSGASQMVSSAAQPVGVLLVGWLAAALGPLIAVRVNGVLMLAFSVALFALSADFRRWVPEPSPSSELDPAVELAAIAAE